jgi:predicted outer membrane repeat protein
VEMLRALSVGKAAGESPTAKKDTHRPGLAPALGLRAGSVGFFIVSQANLNEETRTMSFTHWLRNLRSQTRRVGRISNPSQRQMARARGVNRYRPRLELLEDRLTPSTLTVTSALDEFDGGTLANPAGADGQLSLREAIGAASSGDQITFAQSLSGSTINLDSAQGELLLTKNLNILGLGSANLAISGQNQSRVFEIAYGVTDTIFGLTIENGKTGNPPYGWDGGGILNQGNVTVSSCTLANNSGQLGGAICNRASLTVTDSAFFGNYANQWGGGIAHVGSTTTVSNSTFSNNTGGGIGMQGGTVTVNNSTLTGNNGVGIESFGGTLNVNASTISNTTRDLYGAFGILNYNGTTTITDSHISGNAVNGIVNYGTLTVHGGSVSDNSAGSIYGNGGGGIESLNGTVTVSDVDFSGNRASDGGAISASNLTVTDCNFTNNSTYNSNGRGGAIVAGGLVTVSGSTFLGNSAGYGGAIALGDGVATVSGSTLTGNLATYGGAIYSTSYYGSTLNVNGSLITGNSATNGGGIDNDGGKAQLNITNSTVCGNSAPIGADISNHNPGLLTITGASDVCGIAQATTTTFVSSSGSSVFGQSVTFTATVVAPDGGTPTGTVTFIDFDSLTGAPLGTATLDSSGHATITTSALGVGEHFIVAIYNGASNWADSQGGELDYMVLSAQQELSVIINQVTNLVTNGILDSVNGNALIVKLNNAITSLNSGNTIAGDKQMDAFINQTNAFLKSGKLDSTDAQALVSDIDLAIAAALVSPI